MHANDILAAQGLRNATVVDRDDIRGFAAEHPAAGGLVETTNSSRRRRDGLRQRGLRRPADSVTERTPTAVRYIDGLRNGWRAAKAVQDAMVSDRPVPSTDSVMGHPAASGSHKTTLSSRRQRDGLRQRDCEQLSPNRMPRSGLRTHPSYWATSHTESHASGSSSRVSISQRSRGSSKAAMQSAAADGS